MLSIRNSARPLSSKPAGWQRALSTRSPRSCSTTLTTRKRSTAGFGGGGATGGAALARFAFAFVFVFGFAFAFALGLDVGFAFVVFFLGGRAISASSILRARHRRSLAALGCRR